MLVTPAWVEISRGMLEGARARCAGRGMLLLAPTYSGSERSPRGPRVVNQSFSRMAHFGNVLISWGVRLGLLRSKLHSQGLTPIALRARAGAFGQYYRLSGRGDRAFFRSGHGGNIADSKRAITPHHTEMVVARTRATTVLALWKWPKYNESAAKRQITKWQMYWTDRSRCSRERSLQRHRQHTQQEMIWLYNTKAENRLTFSARGRQTRSNERRINSARNTIRFRLATSTLLCKAPLRNDRYTRGGLADGDAMRYGSLTRREPHREKMIWMCG